MNSAVRNVSLKTEQISKQWLQNLSKQSPPFEFNAKKGMKRNEQTCSENRAESDIYHNFKSPKMARYKLETSMI